MLTVLINHNSGKPKIWAAASDGNGGVEIIWGGVLTGGLNSVHKNSAYAISKMREKLRNGYVMGFDDNANGGNNIQTVRRIFDAMKEKYATNGFSQHPDPYVKTAAAKCLNAVGRSDLTSGDIGSTSAPPAPAAKAKPKKQSKPKLSVEERLETVTPTQNECLDILSGF